MFGTNPRFTPHLPSPCSPQEQPNAAAAVPTEDEEEEERRYALDPSQRLVCRFYENQYPEIEEVACLCFMFLLAVFLALHESVALVISNRLTFNY